LYGNGPSLKSIECDIFATPVGGLFVFVPTDFGTDQFSEMTGHSIKSAPIVFYFSPWRINQIAGEA
jgi:hypothetical protein